MRGSWTRAGWRIGSALLLIGCFAGGRDAATRVDVGGAAQPRANDDAANASSSDHREAAADAADACARVDVGAAARPPTPTARLDAAACLEAAGRLRQAGAIYAELGRDVSDPDGKQQLGARIGAFLLRGVKLDGLPREIALAEASVPHPLVAAEIAGRSGLFLWDSGSELGVLGDPLCAELGLVRMPEGRLRDTSGRPKPGLRTAVLDRPLALGALQLPAHGVACLDLSALRAAEPRLLGVLGGNVLGAAPYELDLAARTLRFGAALPARLTRLDAEFVRGVPHVTAELDGHRVRFVLDSGARQSTIAASLLARLNVRAVATGAERTYADASGVARVPEAHAAFASFRSGEFTAPGIRLAVGPTSRLGVDFLQGRTLAVDAAAGVVAFVPRDP
jgi:hypothetical protein